MQVPTDQAFHPVRGLNVRGAFMPILIVTQAELGDGLVWMRAALRTRDRLTSEPAEIIFTTPYPSNIDAKWRVADFISWVVSHEMMETFSLDDTPLYHGVRLVKDHEAILTDTRVYMSRLAKVRDRYHRDRVGERWMEEIGLHEGGLDLSLNPAFR